MGFIRKGIKDMRTTVAAAPAMIRQANQLGAQAQQLQRSTTAPAAEAAQAAQMQAMMAGTTIGPDDPRLEPIAGVTLEQYASIAKAAATPGVDSDGLVSLAVARGVASEAAWHEAQDGWNARMKGDTQLATHFGHLYQAVGA
jgi:hypothetical protein